MVSLDFMIMRNWSNHRHRSNKSNTYVSSSATLTQARQKWYRYKSNAMIRLCKLLYGHVKSTWTALLTILLNLQKLSVPFLLCIKIVKNHLYKFKLVTKVVFHYEVWTIKINSFILSLLKMILKTIFKSTRIWFYLYKQYNRKHSLSINIINYNYKMYKIILS